MLKIKKIFIIDGYNVLRSNYLYKDKVGDAPNFKDWVNEMFNSAREALLNDVSLMTDSNTEAIIVYDGSGNKSKNKNFSKSKIKRVQVLFSDYKQTADELIENLCYNAREKGFRVTVVTSDFQIQFTTLNNNVTRMSAREFCNYIESNTKYSLVDSLKYNKDISMVEKKSKSDTHSSSTIEKFIDGETANKLLQLRNRL